MWLQPLPSEFEMSNLITVFKTVYSNDVFLIQLSYPNSLSCMFLQCRKKQDLYLWMSKCPSGPSVKFLVKAGKY